MVLQRFGFSFHISTFPGVRVIFRPRIALMEPKAINVISLLVRLAQAELKNIHMNESIEKIGIKIKNIKIC